MRHPLTKIAFLAFALLTIGRLVAADDSGVMTAQQREIALEMLRNTSDVVKKHYYDSKFHDTSFETRLKQADEKIKSSRTLSDAFGVIAWALDGLNDSHTFFLPPSRPFDVENGWQMAFVGDKCFIVAVKPGSDADAQGVKPGDQILAIEGFQPTRQTLSKMQYAFNTLAPRSGFHLVLVNPQGQQRTLEVHSKVHKLVKNLNLTGQGAGSQDIWDVMRRQQAEERLLDWKYVDVGEDLMIWKMPTFLDASESQVDALISRVRTHKALVLDLRDNGGGDESLLMRVLSGVFENDVTLGERVGRTGRKTLIVKGKGSHSFNGKLAVLINCNSASAAELFARTVQLQNRGAIVGDLSCGRVMEAQIFPQTQGVDIVTFYAVEVTVANLIMADGKSLEHTGVQPDELVLPTAQDLAAGRDPQMARAASLVGITLTAERAGTLFPIVWRTK